MPGKRKKEEPSTPPKTLRQLMDERLKESGLNGADAKALELETLTPQQVIKLDASFKPYAAMRIPYHDARGRRTPFYRLRYLGEMEGFDKLRKKAPRYVQPPDTDPEVYLPRSVDWSNMMGLEAAALLITEGELKAACACSMGFPTIGLGGVWSWRTAKKGSAFLPALNAFSWKGRMAYLVFDSDYGENPDVMRALVALARELNSKGARPALVTLPEQEDLQEQGKKTGLDDFLVRRGKKALEALLEDAVPFSQTEELWRLNGEVVYIRDPGLIVHLPDGRKIAPGAFKEHAFANRHYHETAFDAKGNAKLVKKPLAPAWLQWEERAELQRLTYRPGDPAIVDGQYNYWPGWGAEPKKGDISLWKRLLDYAFQADPKARKWFEQWAAWPVQHPGEKLYAATVVWGRTQGTGKSLIGYSLGSVYGKNFSEIGEDQLGKDFNEWAENKQFVLGDDVTGSEYRKATMDLLKFMITRQKLRVNTKYLPSYEVPDCINYYFTSNYPDAFLLDDTDRRYFVWEMPEDPMPRSFYDEYDVWLRSGRAAPALLYHLLHVDLTGFNPRAHAMDTPAKRAMILDGKSDAATWCATLREDPDTVLRAAGHPLPLDLYTNTQLLLLYDPEGKKKVTANGLGRELKKAGFHQANGGAVVRTTRGPMRLYAVRNADVWRRANAKQCADHVDAAMKAAGAKGKPKF